MYSVPKMVDGGSHHTTNMDSAVEHSALPSPEECICTLLQFTSAPHASAPPPSLHSSAFALQLHVLKAANSAEGQQESSERSSSSSSSSSSSATTSAETSCLPENIVSTLLYMLSPSWLPSGLCSSPSLLPPLPSSPDFASLDALSALPPSPSFNVPLYALTLLSVLLHSSKSPSDWPPHLLLLFVVDSMSNRAWHDDVSPPTTAASLEDSTPLLWLRDNMAASVRYLAELHTTLVRRKAKKADYGDDDENTSSRREERAMMLQDDYGAGYTFFKDTWCEGDGFDVECGGGKEDDGEGRDEDDEDDDEDDDDDDESDDGESDDESDDDEMEEEVDGEEIAEGEGDAESSSDEDSDDHESSSALDPASCTPFFSAIVPPPPSSSSSLSSLSSSQVRPRFIGAAAEEAISYIVSALSHRLHSPNASRHNAAFLHTLTSLCAIPEVRLLAARSLPKFFSSPALASGGRSLCQTILDHIDVSHHPPLKTDVEAINAIATMTIKPIHLANHIASVVSIARRTKDPSLIIPVFKLFLLDEFDGIVNPNYSVSSLGDKFTPTTDKMKTFVAMWHAVVSRDVKHYALGRAISDLCRPLSLTATSRGGEPHSTATPLANPVHEGKLHALVRRLVSYLCKDGYSDFDPSLLVRGLLTFRKAGREADPHTARRHQEVLGRLAFVSTWQFAAVSAAAASSASTQAPSQGAHAATGASHLGQSSSMSSYTPWAPTALAYSSSILAAVNSNSQVVKANAATATDGTTARPKGSPPANPAVVPCDAGFGPAPFSLGPSSSLVADRDRASTSMTAQPPPAHLRPPTRDDNFLAAALLRIRKFILEWLARIYIPALHASELASAATAAGSQQPPVVEELQDLDMKEASSASDYLSDLVPGDLQLREVQLQGGEAPQTLGRAAGQTQHCAADDRNAKLEAMMRCLLFLDFNPSSIATFLLSSSTASSSEPQPKISALSKVRRDVDDALLSALVSHSVAMKCVIPNIVCLRLVESLVGSCRPGSKNQLLVCDGSIVEHIFKLAEYKVPKNRIQNQFVPMSSLAMIPRPPPPTTIIAEGNSPDGSAMDLEVSAIASPIPVHSRSLYRQLSIPKLAHPSLYWRACAVVIALAAASPSSIGKAAWDSNATLRSLIKIAVSSELTQYPPIGSEDPDSVAATEREMKETEFDLTSRLFMPFELREKLSFLNEEIAEVEEQSLAISETTSERQRERARKLQKHELLTLKAKSSALMKTVQKALKNLSKSTMLLPEIDEKSNRRHVEHPRKPRRNALALISSVLQTYNVSSVFRACTNPDLLMLTLGNSSRESIRSSYKWLIPLISVHPSIIDRLPASASCYLLLEAFNDASDSTLMEFSTPLVNHTTRCLHGEFGEESAVLAAKLLLADVSSGDVGERLCARKVLQGCLGGSEFEASTVNCGWMFVIKGVLPEKIITLVADCLRKGIFQERGVVLRFFVSALNALLVSGQDIAQVNPPKAQVELGLLLSRMISSRVLCCEQALSMYQDFFEICSSMVLFFLDNPSLLSSDDGESCVSFTSAKTRGAAVEIPLAVLRSVAIIVGNYVDENHEGIGIVNESVGELVKHIFDTDFSTKSSILGVAGASFLRSDQGSAKSALPVDLWHKLMKCKCPRISFLASICAPVEFLPALACSSGLPKDNVQTMMKRLSSCSNKYADYVSASSGVFTFLGFDSSCPDSVVGRSLFARIKSYVSLYSLQEDLDFYRWLKITHNDTVALSLPADSTPSTAASSETRRSQRVKVSDTPSQLNPCPASFNPGGFTDAVKSAAVAAALCYESDLNSAVVTSLNSLAAKPQWNLLVDSTSQARRSLPPLHTVNREFVESCISNRSWCILSDAIEAFYNCCATRGSSKAATTDQAESMSCPQIANVLLSAAISSTTFDGDISFGQLILRYVPPFAVLRHGGGTRGEEEEEKVMEGTLRLIYSSEKVGRSDVLSEIAYSLPYYATLNFVRSALQAEAREAKESLGFLLFAKYFLRNYRDPTSAEECRTVCEVAMSTAGGFGIVDGSMEDGQQVAGELLMKLSRSKKVSKDACKLVASVLLPLCKEVEEVTASGRKYSRKVFASTFLLRQYCAIPDAIPLNIGDLREVLLNAVVTEWPLFLTFDCELDSAMNSSLSEVAGLEFGSAAIAGLCDIGKRHPLLLLRKLGEIADMLEQDGHCRTGQWGDEKHSRSLSKESLRRKCLLEVNEENSRQLYKSVLVKVKHWGYEYCDFFWAGCLAIVLSIPKEILFEVQSGAVAAAVINKYVKLLSVRALLVGAAALKENHRLKGICDSLSVLLSRWKVASSSSFDKWYAGVVDGVDGWGDCKTILRELVGLSGDFSASAEPATASAEGGGATLPTPVTFDPKLDDPPKPAAGASAARAKARNVPGGGEKAKKSKGRKKAASAAAKKKGAKKKKTSKKRRRDEGGGDDDDDGDEAYLPSSRRARKVKKRRK